MGLPVREDLGTMRQEIKDRLGYGASGSSFTANNNIIDAMIRDAQYQIYWEHSFTELTIIDATTISQQGQESYDWPDNIEPKKILSIWVEDRNQSAGNWYKMCEGIGPEHYGRVSTAEQGRPSRYERRNQLDIWRRPDSNLYTFHIEGTTRLNRLTAETDRATLNEQLIKLYALANGKGHYRHPDAPALNQQYILLLRNLTAGDKGKKRFVRASGKSRQYRDNFYDPDFEHQNTLD